MPFTSQIQLNETAEDLEIDIFSLCYTVIR